MTGPLFPGKLAIQQRVLTPYRAAFLADADSAAFDLAAALPPPLRPPVRAGSGFDFFPRPDPLFLPPPEILLTVAQARRSASFLGTPRSSYPSSICSAWRFCLAVYFNLSPRGMMSLLLPDSKG